MMVPDCIERTHSLSEMDLSELEVVAFCSDGVPQRCVQVLIREVRRLRHELEDPSFMYAGGRIRRDAILCREAEIDQLREQIKKLKTEDSK